MIWYRNHVEAVMITQGEGEIELVAPGLSVRAVVSVLAVPCPFGLALALCSSEETFCVYVLYVFVYLFQEGEGVVHKLGPGTVYALNGQERHFLRATKGDIHCVWCVSFPCLRVYGLRLVFVDGTAGVTWSVLMQRFQSPDRW